MGSFALLRMAAILKRENGMKTHYYLDWYEGGFSEKLAKLLQEDIKDRKSIVFISAQPSDYWDIEVGVIDIAEKAWFGKAGINFGEYNLIDRHTKKEDAQKLVQNASVIFLCGGSSDAQGDILTECKLADFIKESKAILMGTSAGAINMSAKFIWSKHHNYKDKTEVTIFYEGMGLDHLSFEPHFDLNNVKLIEDDFFPLSNEVDIYGADRNGAVRIKGGKIDIIGNVYLISKSKMRKLDETI
jgi:cyanophycinase